MSNNNSWFPSADGPRQDVRDMESDGPAPDAGFLDTHRWILAVAGVVVLALIATLVIVLTRTPRGAAPAVTPSTTAAPATSSTSSTAAASSTSSTAPSTTAATTTSTTSTTPASSTVVANAYPLTGLPVKGTSGPALCIKIENSIEARPQLGLDSADIVYEEVVEGGITRYMAVFQSNIPAKVEPVRSMRPMDPPMVLPLGCPLIFSGAQVPFLQAAAATGIQMIYMDRGDPGFSRDSAKAAPHNVIGDTAKFLAQIQPVRVKPPAPPFTFATSAAESTAGTQGKAAKSLNLTLSSVAHPNWTWDATSGQWLRSEGSTQAVAANGKRLSATNVVALTVLVQNTTFTDPANNPVPETKIVGSGKGVVASGGKTVAVSWSKASEREQMVLTDASGAPVKLAPGNTWVELVPTTGSITPQA